MKNLNFDIALAIKLFIAFIMMTVIGTLTHELGHYSVSKYLGSESNINYKSSTYWDNKTENYLNEIKKKYSIEISNNIDFPYKDKFQKIAKKTGMIIYG